VPTYLDTSALLRIVEKRGDYAVVDAALRNEPISSTLAELECWASVHKKWLDGEIDAALRDGYLEAATSLLSSVQLLAMDEEVLADAFTLTQIHPLRTLDGLHLATAAVARRVAQRRGVQVRFCTGDRRQAQAAERHFGAEQVDLVPSWR
jgi:predicted nucleic acid-binding protein